MDLSISRDVARARAEAPLRADQLGLSPVTAFISGSLVEGLGNATSDIDVYVVVPAMPEDLPSLESREVAQRRADFLYVTQSQLLELASAVRDVSQLHQRGPLSDGAAELCHRILVGQPLQNAAAFAALRAQFDPRCVQMQLLNKMLGLIDISLEDVWGMVDAGDLDCACFLARDVAHEAAIAFLLSIGETNIKMKWTAKLMRLRASEPRFSAVRSEYWATQFPADELTSESARRAFIDRCVRFSHQTTERAQNELYR